MAWNISTVCSKCGKQPPEATTFRIISTSESVCTICEPLPLEGSCSSCAGHGTVNIFRAWATLNRVADLDFGGFAVLSERLPKCRTRKEVRDILMAEGFYVKYPMVPDWLPE